VQAIHAHHAGGRPEAVRIAYTDTAGAITDEQRAAFANIPRTDIGIVAYAGRFNSSSPPSVLTPSREILCRQISTSFTSTADFGALAPHDGLHSFA
jgi:hypothetical protein